MIVAKTDRLIISQFTIEDASFFMALVNTPNWIKYIGDRNIKTTEQAEERITNGHLKSYKTHGFGFYILRLKDSLKPIGTCGLIKRETLDTIDFGFAMLPEYEGLGFGFESSQAILKLAKEVLQIEKLVAITLETNKNSIKLLQKLGFHFEKIVKPFEDDEELMLFAKNL
ncbi:GNAT family N-acetyltransferase [Lacinutrix jangbogonensis]|uniref:GNAT family N-acetyltransferase n=1 Tax=Lacinutrix jangbogonensis TaxID=1469557 RepID=UPI00053D3204|nr:GNAT family N-acetyltransferase [Lacinutrix jangbogonensis]